MAKEYSPEIQTLLMQVVEACQMEDASVRERQIRQWRQLKLLWEGFLNIWYSEVAHDWRILSLDNDNDDTGQAYYDKSVNVFRAYLESIIAALSVTVPPIKCFPDDADNTLDLATAKAGDRIGQLIYRHNEVPLIWLKALFTYVTEGMTACYTYTKEDEKYGTYEKKEYDEVEEERDILVCSLCGYQIEELTPEGQEFNELNNQEKDEFNPEGDEIGAQSFIQSGQELCPSCMQMMDPEVRKEKFIVTRLVGITQEPKSRICMEVYGGLYVKIPNYARKQADIPYLILSYETDYAMAVERYSHLRNADKIRSKLKSGNEPDGYSQYAQWGRLSPQYQGEYPTNVVTMHHTWLRPAKFNILSEEEAEKLKKEFPFGVKVVTSNGEFCEACPESLDDHWTLTENPLSDYLHFNPMGQSLVSVQEITNDLISLTLQTIEHGIGQTFADPAVLDFNAYQQTEVLPGGVFPATPKSGKTLSEGFAELRTASLSPEVMPFGSQIQSLGQLAVGALPSLFGGQLEGSETASEYSMSRAQALQRQQNTWKLFTGWWKNIFGKIIPAYIKEVQEDERDVQLDDDGNFINVFIRKAELEGKIGKVELASDENLPMTWVQKKDLIINLLTNPNPKIMEILGAPENLPIIHDVLGIPELYIPGENDVIKQYDEIKILLNSGPIPDPDSGMEIPSVEIDPVYDNHYIEFDVCKKWVTSEAGRIAKLENPEGYRNVLLHGMGHFNMIQQNQMQSVQEQGAAPDKKPDITKTKEAPITGDSDVQTMA